MVNLEDLTKPQLIKIIKTYNKEVKIAYTNKTKQELIEIIKYFMNVYEGYIETKPKKIVMEKKKQKKVKDPLKELIGQRGLLRGEIDRYKTELEDMKVELEYDLKLKNDKKFVEKYKQKVNDVNKLIIQLKEVNKQISKLEPSKAKAPERNLKKELEKLLSKSKQQEERDIKQNKEFEEIEKQFKEASKPKAKAELKKEPKKDYYKIKDSEVKNNYIDNLKYKDLEFKNVSIEKIKDENQKYYRTIISNIYENEEHNAHKSFIDTEQGKNSKILKILLVNVMHKFRGQQYTEKTFMLLWAYIKKIKLLEDIKYIELDYAATVPVWTTYNRMINEVGYYNKFFDELLKYDLDNDTKLLVHEVLRGVEYETRWFRPTTQKEQKMYYENFIKEFISILRRDFEDKKYEKSRKIIYKIFNVEQKKGGMMSKRKINRNSKK